MNGSYVFKFNPNSYLLIYNHFYFYIKIKIMRTS